MTTRAATRASASRPTESKRSRLAIRRDRRRASQTAASIDRIASANPSGSSPAPRRAGNTDLQRRSVTILALRAEAGAASDSELSEAAPKHGSLGQPAGGHDMRRALRHGDALAHLIGIVQVVQIAGAVRATANVLVLRPPAGTLFESGIHACPRRAATPARRSGEACTGNLFHVRRGTATRCGRRDARAMAHRRAARAGARRSRRRCHGGRRRPAHAGDAGPRVLSERPMRFAAGRMRVGDRESIGFGKRAKGFGRCA
ncbi:hypothetical protein [Burkholderia pseudomallei]|uniref:hypothetical protein n=1 Tax=Burkholderia pseudomallei TaxID=28450 RepID=UPI00351C8B2E